MVSFATRETPTWKVPFPAVTLCPETKSRPTYFNYTKFLFMKKNNEKIDPEKYTYKKIFYNLHQFPKFQ